MSDEPTFSELLERARSGDREARAKMFDQLGGDQAEAQTILAIARKVLPHGDPARDFVESRDLIQTALRTGWLDLSQFAGDTPGQFFAWLRTILRHKLGRTVRKKKPRIAGSEEAESVDAEDEGPDDLPLDAVLRGEMVERLRSAIDALPDDMRSVVERRLQGVNAPQIAEELDISPAAVRKRESRAMARLRQVIDAESGDGGG